MRQFTLTLSGVPGDSIDYLYTDVPFINLPCIFTHYLELSNF